MLNLFRYVALRQLLEKPGRTSLTILGVAMGIGLSVAIRLINTSTLASFSQTVANLSGSADLSVSAGALGFPEDKLELIENSPVVHSAVPVIEEQAYLIRGREAESLYVLGVDLLRESSVRSYKTEDEQMMDDPQIFLNQPDSLIVSRTVADQYGLKLDSTLELATAHGPKTFTVRGILALEGAAKAFGGTIAIMDIDGARVSFGKEGKMDRVDVVLKPGTKLEDAVTDLQKRLGPGYQIANPKERAESFAQLISSFQNSLRLIASMAVFIGILLIGNTLKIAVAERKKQIGILRSLGTTRRAIVLLFVTEGVFLGLIGTFFGLGIGYVMAKQLVALVISGMSNEYMMYFETPPIQITAHDVFRAILLGIGSSVTASLYPSSLASRVSPIEAMSSTQDEYAEVQMKKGFLVAGAFGVILILLTTLYPWLHIEFGKELISHVTQFTGPLSLLLLTPAMTYLLATVLAKSARALRLSVTTRLAQDHLLRDLSRSTSNVLTLALGLYLVVVISSINVSFKESIGNWSDRALSADLVVSSFGKMGALQTQPLHEDVRKELNQLAVVKDQAQQPAGAMRFIHTDYQGRTIAIKAFDEPEGLEDDGYRFDVIEGEDVPRKVFARDQRQLAISENFAQKFRTRIGDTLTLNTPSGPTDFKVVGVVNDFSSREGVLYMSRVHFKPLWQDPLVNLIYLNLKPTADLGRVKRQIDTELGQKRKLLVKFNTELRQEIMKNIDDSFRYTRAVEWAALLCGLIGMMNMMFVNILERTREIGLLRSVGMTKPQVFKTVLVESMTQGFISAFIASSLGLFLAFSWITFNLSQVLGWIVQFHFSYRTLLSAGLAGIFVAGIAGLLPALRATRLEIKESLAHD